LEFECVVGGARDDSHVANGVTENLKVPWEMRGALPDLEADLDREFGEDHEAGELSDFCASRFDYGVIKGGHHCSVLRSRSRRGGGHVSAVGRLGHGSEVSC
jgi:hypothetical protein